MDKWSVGSSLHTEGITEIHHYAGVRGLDIYSMLALSLCSGLGDFMTLSLSLLVPVFVCLYGWVVDWLYVWLVGWLVVGWAGKIQSSQNLPCLPSPELEWGTGVHVQLFVCVFMLTQQVLLPTKSPYCYGLCADRDLACPPLEDLRT